MATIAIRTLEFARVDWDRADTGRVVLDPGGPSYRMSLRWLPVAETWTLSVWLTSGTPIVLGAFVRDRTDCLLGVSTVGRPSGGIMAYDPKRRGDPGLGAFFSDGVLLLYVPGGLVPADFAAYGASVV